MHRFALPLIALTAVTACATPREQCISNANRGLSQLDRLIATTQSNINRGFALAEVRDVRVLQTSCEGTNEDGSTFRFPCEETETFTRQEPVAIDIQEERRKLVQLQDRRARDARVAADIVQQCIAAHPE